MRKEESGAMEEVEAWLVETFALKETLRRYCEHWLWYAYHSSTYCERFEELLDPPTGAKDPRKAARYARRIREDSFRLSFAFQLLKVIDVDEPLSLDTGRLDCSTDCGLVSTEGALD